MSSYSYFTDFKNYDIVDKLLTCFKELDKANYKSISKGEGPILSHADLKALFVKNITQLNKLNAKQKTALISRLSKENVEALSNAGNAWKTLYDKQVKSPFHKYKSYSENDDIQLCYEKFNNERVWRSTEEKTKEHIKSWRTSKPKNSEFDMCEEYFNKIGYDEMSKISKADLKSCYDEIIEYNLWDDDNHKLIDNLNGLIDYTGNINVRNRLKECIEFVQIYGTKKFKKLATLVDAEVAPEQHNEAMKSDKKCYDFLKGHNIFDRIEQHLIKMSRFL